MKKDFRTFSCRKCKYKNKVYPDTEKDFLCGGCFKKISLPKKIYEDLKNKKSLIFKDIAFYFLIDTSGSMLGEGIESTKYAIELLIKNLKNNKNYENKYINIITFDQDCEIKKELENINDYKIIENITPKKNSVNFLGKCLGTLNNLIKNHKSENIAIIFIFTDSEPCDVMDFIVNNNKFLKKNIPLFCFLTNSKYMDNLKRIEFEDVLYINDLNQKILNLIGENIYNFILTNKNNTQSVYKPSSI